MESTQRLFPPVAERTLRCIVRTASVAVVVAVNMLSPVRAAQREDVEQAAQACDSLRIVSGGRPSSLVGQDLGGLTREGWQNVRRVQLEAVESDEAWVTAAHNIAYLSAFYHDFVNLDAAALPLMQRYALEADEGLRITALAAIAAIGHRDTMARLAARIPLESSPRVRRLTQAAVATYYGERTPSEVRATVPPPDILAEQEDE